MISAEGKENQSFQSWVAKELQIATRFGFVGILATAVHILVVWLLLSGTQLQPLLANLCAFLLAIGVSFSGNYFWTFRLQVNFASAMRRFLIIRVSALGLNTMLLAIILRADIVSTNVAAIFSALIVGGFSFFASKLWAFR